MKRLPIPKPRSIWEWLAFFSPAVAMIVCGTLIPELINAARHETGSRQVAVAMNTLATWGTYGLVVAGVMSLGLGFRLAWKEEESFFTRFISTCAYAVVIGYINVFVAFAGCMAVGVAGNALSR